MVWAAPAKIFQNPFEININQPAKRVLVQIETGKELTGMDRMDRI
jgi:hypothetical protein